MKRPTPPRPPNYLRKLAYLWRIGAIPREVGVHMVNISHDVWCGIYAHRRCNCNPDIRLKATVPQSLN